MDWNHEPVAFLGLESHTGDSTYLGSWGRISMSALGIDLVGSHCGHPTLKWPLFWV